MSIFNYFKRGKQTPKTEQEQLHNSKERADDGVRRVHNLIILDESGSMISIYRPTLSGVNETLQTIRDAQKEYRNQEQYVSLITFDTGHYNKIYSNTPADYTKDIKKSQYRPNGGTPLFDAMGRAINELRPNVAKGDVVLVTILTDGEENSSCEYNAVSIKNLVEAMKEEGWVFTYIGANQVVERVAASMAIDNYCSFEADEECTDAMFENERTHRKAFFAKVASCEPTENLGTGYFD